MSFHLSHLTAFNLSPAALNSRKGPHPQMHSLRLLLRHVSDPLSPSCVSADEKWWKGDKNGHWPNHLCCPSSTNRFLIISGLWDVESISVHSRPGRGERRASRT